MSTFGCEMKEVKTRTPHGCVTCGRTIPKRSQAMHTGGMYEGDWQNWYMCKFCYDHEVYESGEYVSGDEFYYWVADQDFYTCPSCKGIDPDKGKLCRSHPDWEWSEDQKTLLFECDVCGHKWEQYIGFGEEESYDY